MAMGTSETRHFFISIVLYLLSHQSLGGHQRCSAGCAARASDSPTPSRVTPSLKLRGGKAVKPRARNTVKRKRSRDSDSQLSDPQAAEDGGESPESEGAPGWLEELVREKRKRRKQLLKENDLVTQFLAYGESEGESESDSSKHLSELSEDFGPNATKEMLMKRLSEMEAEVGQAVRKRTLTSHLQLEEVEKKNKDHIEGCHACRAHYSNFTFPESESRSFSDESEEVLLKQDPGLALGLISRWVGGVGRGGGGAERSRIGS
eukprot:758248-Hanusia_phi.AAC.1